MAKPAVARAAKKCGGKGYSRSQFQACVKREVKGKGKKKTTARRRGRKGRKPAIAFINKGCAGKKLRSFRACQKRAKKCIRATGSVDMACVKRVA